MFRILIVIISLLATSSVFAFGEKYETVVDEKLLIMWRLDTSSSELSYCSPDFLKNSVQCHKSIKVLKNMSLAGTAQGYLWLFNKKSGSAMYCFIDYVKKTPICSQNSR